MVPKAREHPCVSPDSPDSLGRKPFQIPSPFPQGEALQKRLLPPLRLLPFLVDDYPYPALDPLPKFPHPLLHVRESEVVNPAHEQPRDAFARFPGRGGVVPFGEQSDLGPQQGELRVRHASFPLPVAPFVKGIAKVGEAVGRDDLRLLRVDLEFHPAFDERYYRGHHPLRGHVAPHEDDDVVGVPAEPEPPRLKLLVELVEVDVR